MKLGDHITLLVEPNLPRLATNGKRRKVMKPLNTSAICPGQLLTILPREICLKPRGNVPRLSAQLDYSRLRIASLHSQIISLTNFRAMPYPTDPNARTKEQTRYKHRQPFDDTLHENSECARQLMGLIWDAV